MYMRQFMRFCFQPKHVQKLVSEVSYVYSTVIFWLDLSVLHEFRMLLQFNWNSQ